MDPSPLAVNEAFFNEVRRNVQAAIVEDVGSGDINAALISKEQIATAHLITRTAGVFWVSPGQTKPVSKLTHQLPSNG